MRFLFTILIFCSLNSFGQSVDSFKVYFPLNVRTLTQPEKDKLDVLIYKSLLNTSQSLSILGYADYLADSAYNLTLSHDRAEAVKAYLVQSGFKADAIKLCIGKGKIDRAPINGNKGYAEDRKVVITIDKDTTPPPPPPVVKAPGPPKKDVIDDLKVNETLVLDNIYFLPGRHTVRDISLPELEKLYDVMKSHPTLKIRIEGHVCCVPERGHTDGFDYDDNTWGLSINRARAIYNYLIEKGIDEDRLQYQGFGRLHPLVDPELTEDDQNKNRRVEIRILGK